MATPHTTKFVIAVRAVRTSFKALVMSLNKKKGSFTAALPQGGDARVSGKTAGVGGANSVRVILLDGTVLPVSNVDKKTLGQVVFDQVVRRLDLLERDYFGLLYEDDHKTMKWLDLLKPIKKQLKKQPYTMFFRVKFYAVDPLALHRNSKEQFYLQLKQDISAGRLPFPSESAHSILSYVLQADVGDYQNSHDDLQYLQEKGLLVLGKDRTAESSIIKLHKLLQGKGPDLAVEKFLRKTQDLDSYGAKFNIVQCEGIPYWMAMSPGGITLYQDTRRIVHFKWRKILQVSYKNKRFTLRIKSRSSESGEREVVYEVDSAKLCKEMWEQCVERVSFYNEHHAHYKESAITDGGSRSPTPPITREYATINDATPQLEAARQQSLQSSPSHSSQQDAPNQHLQLLQRGREQRENHTEGNSREEDRAGESVRESREKGERRDKGEERDRHMAQQHSQSPQASNGVGERDASQGRDEDTLKRKLNSSKFQSLPRRLPTGDPMLHHMMQFQNLELYSSHGTLLSESNSPTETTSPIVSTCDEASELSHQYGSRGAKHAPEGGHVRSQSLPYPQTEQWRSEDFVQTGHATRRHEDTRLDEGGKGRDEERRGGMEGESRGREEAQDHSISEGRGTGEESMQESLEELADLLGDPEAPADSQKSTELERPLEQSTPTSDPKGGNGLPSPSQGEQQKHAAEGLEVVVESSPEVAREERERRRKRKQLQKQILLQRQQIKEQKLQEYLKKRKKREHEKGQISVPVTVDSRRHSEKVNSHGHPSKRNHNEKQLEDSSHVAKSHAGDIRTRERGQYSLKAHPNRSHQRPSSSPGHRNTADTGAGHASLERKLEERDLVRSWAKAQRKAHKESRSPPSTMTTSSAPHVSLQHNHSNPMPAEPIYNTLAPKQKEDENGSTATEEGMGRSLELLPSSPPPPPYKSPSPTNEARVIGLAQMPSRGHSEVDSSTGMLRETELDKAVVHETQALTPQRSFGSRIMSTPPTPRSGERLGGPHSTTSKHSPQSLSSTPNRSPRYTHSFSGRSPAHSGTSSATGSSPHTPTRARSMKSGQYSPAKQQSPSQVARRIAQERTRQDGSTTTTQSDGSPPIVHKHSPQKPVQDSSNEFESRPIDINPSALQKDDLTIAPHNFLDASSPLYDKLGIDDDGQKEVSSLSQRIASQSGTQYKLETALQEVMTSENLPPPPTHLLEISGELEDIDYQDLDAPPTAVSRVVIPSRGDFELQKTDINPEMIAKSLDAPRKASNPTQYPPHIAKFMSRVRSSSSDGDDLTAQVRDNASTHLTPDSVKSSTVVDSAASDDVFAAQVGSDARLRASIKSELRPKSQAYEVPKSVLGKTLSLEHENKKPCHPFAIAGTKPPSGGPSVGKRQAPATSYSLPRGGHAMLQQFSVGSSSQAITPSSAHAHTQSDVGAGDNHSREDHFQSVSSHALLQSMGYSQNGVSRPNSIRPRGHGRANTASGDSIPNSPTYFTQNHPHKDNPMPSPETQSFNQSFKDHLSSLQPSTGVRSTNIANWMQESSDYWNTNKSVPLFKDRRTVFPSKPPNRSPHFYDKPESSQLLPHSPPIGPPTPAITGTNQPRQPHPIIGRPIVHIPHSTQKPLPPHWHQQPIISAPMFPLGGREPNLLASSASNPSLQRNPRAPLMSSVQALPNYPRPHTAKTAAVGEYYVLDV